MDRPKDYYGLLGVDRDASAGRDQARLPAPGEAFHPDRGAGSSTEDFQELQAAYETLADAERRRRYDERLREASGRRAPSWAYRHARRRPPTCAVPSSPAASRARSC